MEIRNYGNQKILIAKENHHIRSKDDVYVPEKRDEQGNIVESEKKPYYTSIVYLANNIDETQINDLYVEEEIEKEAE